MCGCITLEQRTSKASVLHLRPGSRENEVTLIISHFILGAQKEHQLMRQIFVIASKWQVLNETAESKIVKKKNR